MKKVTVILSGVGMYGYSGIALMELFDKHQIKPNLIVGCSEGALIAALWAKGYSPVDALKIVRQACRVSQAASMNVLNALFFFKSPRGEYTKENALLKVKHIQKVYHEVFKDQLIEHLPVQTIFQTTDVELGETHYIRTGLLADAIYASSAILPFYPAIKMNDKWLADGVFSEFLPMRVVLDEKSDVIIAIDPQIPANREAKTFMFAYAQFLQKALKISSAPRTALVYDLHNDEILIIPIKVACDEKGVHDESLQQLLESARANIADKEALILQTIGH
jgi:NTE family protein